MHAWATTVCIWSRSARSSRALDGAAADESSASTTSTVSPGSTTSTVAATSTTEVPKAWLGIRSEASVDGVVTVYEVALDSPAALAGIVPGDVVKAVDGVAVADRETLARIVMSHAIGENVVLSVLKVGATAPVELTITLVAKPWSL